MFSDGFQDQFGGKENKKFLRSRMKKLFFEIHQENMPDQKKIISQKINDWIKEGIEGQIDDILVWGIKVNVKN